MQSSLPDAKLLVHQHVSLPRQHPSVDSPPDVVGGHSALIACVTLAFIALLTLGSYWAVRFQVARDLDEAALRELERSAVTLTEAVSEQTRGALYNVDLAIQHLAHVYRVHGDLTDANVQLVNDAAPDGLVRRVTVIGADGRARVTFPVGGKGLDLSDRPHFLAHRNNETKGLFIGVPIPSRVESKWVIPVSRALRDRDGRFVGVIEIGRAHV